MAVAKSAVTTGAAATPKSSPDIPSMTRSDAAPQPIAALTLAALGIVYGDIGTSPLYALRECFVGDHGLPPTPGNVYGILSLVFWSLLLIISVKYLVFILRADNQGEGGVLSLLALVTSRQEMADRSRSRSRSKSRASSGSGGSDSGADGLQSARTAPTEAIEAPNGSSRRRRAPCPTRSLRCAQVPPK